MKKRLIASFLAVVPLLVIAGLAVAGGQSSLDVVRQATAPYHDIAVARDAGYTVELEQTSAFGGGTCIANGDEGAMGIHLLSPARLDGTLDPANPEALLYEKRNNGTYKLTGVEYVVAGGSQPESFGQQFTLTNLGRFGSPEANVWTLHAWIWKPNPAGIFNAWNTRVTCD